MSLELFHPAVADWFRGAFQAPTEAQLAAWPAIRSGRHTLVAAPTGSGKTLTAFMAAIDALVREGLDGKLADETAVVYVSPLKALSNDIRLNLEQPLAGIRAELARRGLPDVEIRTAVRTGDTPQSERARMRKCAPHILVTTPESLYVLLGSDSGRAMLASVRTVIVDEIHAVADDKRGSHLSLSLERLEALAGHRLTRIGLSATQKPIAEVARFLVGTANVATDGTPDCSIVDIGYAKQRDLALELPDAPLTVVMTNDQWDQVYKRIATFAQAHRTTLVFVNTRRMAERAARHLGELLGKDAVAAHHGSLARELRLDAEQKLKHGELRVLVATASLELGIDIGDVDLVCQLGSPRSIAAFLQRAGRAGHHVGGVPKARLFPQSRDDLVECAALLDCVRRGELDALELLPAPLDVLAQQIVAEVASREWDEDALFDWLRRAWPYARLQRADYDAIVRMLAEGYTTRRGVRAGYLHRDAVNRKLRGRAGARMTAVTSGGTIPETADYSVLLEPQAQTIGSVNEDFAVESLAGDVFQLGNTSYRILKIEPGRLRVEDAQGAAPNIPFWLGEAPGRTDELSFGVSRLREEIAERVGSVSSDAAAGSEPSPPAPFPEAEAGKAEAIEWLVDDVGLGADAARQLVDYIARTQAALGTVPSQRRIVLERFFDESGGTQLVIHTPFGSRINRAWGLALRKRFCRKFNFELQAAATEDAIVLSLSTSHSFPLIEVSRYLHSASALDILVQALLDAPLFGVRWRWNATTALALPRFSGGTKVAPQLQRMKSEDLLATVFPDQVACAENLVGEREVPDHPLVAQTLRDCLYEAMDARGWLDVLRRMEAQEIEIVARDLTAPSPLAAEALNARPYAFLDDAPLEERRTQAVQSRRYADPESADDLGALDAQAIDAVREEAWPQARNDDEMHEALMGLGFVADHEAAAHATWPALLQKLAKDHRATLLVLPRGADISGMDDAGCEPLVQTLQELATDRRRHAIVTPTGGALWVAAERLPEWEALHPGATLRPIITAPAEYAQASWIREDALVELLRARLTGLGPTTSASLAGSIGIAPTGVESALQRLQVEGYVMQGRFTPGSECDQWCERHLLARIHRYTLRRLRREVEPVEPRDFMRFLFDWQRVAADARANGPDALVAVLSQLEGFEAPAAAWEGELLPARVADYSITWLDDLCTAGRTLWTRLRGAQAEPGAAGRGSLSVRATPIVLLPRRHLAPWTQVAGATGGDPAPLSSRAQRVADVLAAQGASFFDELAAGARLLRTELEDALAELVARGAVHCDSYAGLRALLVPASRRASSSPARRRRRASLLGIEDAGRWALIRRERSGADAAKAGKPAPEALEHIARTLLRRYGVVCWRLLEREAAWLPPWRDLVRVYHRLEARGELRGGRFIAGLSGEQFALPDAVGLLRQVRQRASDGTFVCVSASDPLNLAGTVLPGDKVPRLPGARVLYRDGVPLAALVAGEIRLFMDLSQDEVAEARRRLLREPVSAWAAAPSEAVH